MMRHSYTLKQAVIAALAVLAIGAQNNAHALGLGNINVKSYLGQPLRASVKIQGASELNSETCFRVINDNSAENSLTSVNFKLSNVVNDSATLTVTTNQIISEPIANLSIIADCNVNVRRDYVLLLDPLMQATPQISAEAGAASDDDVNATNTKIAAIKKISEPRIQPQMISSEEGSEEAVASKKPAGKKKKKKRNTNQDVVLTTGYNDVKTVETANLTPKPIVNESKQRLSISGGEAISNAPDSVNLRLDKQLHFSVDAPPEVAVENIEIQDEATVLSNRMMHLETQINALTQANQKLKDENKVNTQQLAEANSANNRLDWLGYILGGALLLSALTIAERIRSRHQLYKLQEAELSFASNNQTNNNSAYIDKFNVNDDFFGPATKQDFKDTEIILADKPEDFVPIKESDTTIAVDELDSENNILDHADVFLSHGRTSLAIQLLQNHLLDHPKNSVTIWLFLLDLMARENMQGAYEQTALECKEHFNIRIAAFSNDEASPKQHLEDFPRLNAGLQEVWGTPAALVYLDDLIYNSRLETRAGFEKSVLEELLLLKNIAQELAASAVVIQIDEKKIALKELKEAQIAAKKAEKLQQMDELAMLELVPKLPGDLPEAKETLFEFNLVDLK